MDALIATLCIGMSNAISRCSTAWFRSTDLGVMSPPLSHWATVLLECIAFVISYDIDIMICHIMFTILSIYNMMLFAMVSAPTTAPSSTQRPPHDQTALCIISIASDVSRWRFSILYVYNVKAHAYTSLYHSITHNSVATRCLADLQYMRLSNCQRMVLL